ncbi:hypothetical protein KY284_010804 [Solanum tuberosum]|nr:hypothetical protein KY284_010804 [Solanum tuberosum]
MSFTAKDEDIGIQDDELTKVLILIMAQLDVLEIAKNSHNTMSMTDVLRIHQYPMPQVSRQAFRAQVHQSEDRFGDYEDEFEEAYHLRNESRAPRVRVKNDNLSSIKMMIPTFKAIRDPNLYLNWERKVEAIFDCHNYSGGKNVNLVVVEFSYYDSNWWKRFYKDRIDNGESLVVT